MPIIAECVGHVIRLVCGGVRGNYGLSAVGIRPCMYVVMSTIHCGISYLYIVIIYHQYTNVYNII